MDHESARLDITVLQAQNFRPFLARPYQPYKARKDRGKILSNFLLVFQMIISFSAEKTWGRVEWGEGGVGLSDLGQKNIRLLATSYILKRASKVKL